MRLRLPSRKQGPGADRADHLRERWRRAVELSEVSPRRMGGCARKEQTRPGGQCCHRHYRKRSSGTYATRRLIAQGVLIQLHGGGVTKVFEASFRSRLSCREETCKPSRRRFRLISTRPAPRRNRPGGRDERCRGGGRAKVSMSVARPRMPGCPSFASKVSARFSKATQTRK